MKYHSIFRQTTNEIKETSFIQVWKKISHTNHPACMMSYYFMNPLSNHKVNNSLKRTTQNNANPT